MFYDITLLENIHIINIEIVSTILSGHIFDIAP